MKIFTILFQNSMGLVKWRCDVLGGTNQGWVFIIIKPKFQIISLTSSSSMPTLKTTKNK
jgi:hypothetical protein